jgi:histidinol-phosphate aminotransferase
MIRRPILDHLRPYVPGKKIEGGIKLSSNENPFGPAPAAIRAAQEALGQVHRYPDGGMHLLKAAIAEKEAVSDRQIVVGNGSDEIMVMIAGATMEPGCNAVSAAHTFSQYEFASRIYGGEYRTASMCDYRFDLQAIAGIVDESTRLVWLCNPNNPTGTSFSHEELDRFLGELPHHPLVVMDEAYAEFAEHEDYPRTLELMDRYPNMIRLRTFSKIYGLAALRVGYGIAPSGVIDAVSCLRQPFNVGSAAQAAAVAALSDISHATETLENNRSGKKELCEFLTTHGIPFLQSEANFVCAQTGPATEHLVRALAERRISIRPLASFGLPEHVRISVGTQQEMQAFYSAMAAALTEHAGVHA